MEANNLLESYLLKNYVDDHDFELPSYLKGVFEGKYETVFQTEDSSSLRKLILNVEDRDFEKAIIAVLTSEPIKYLEWFATGISSLLYFIQHNWTGPQSQSNTDFFSRIREKCLEDLSLDVECNENMIKPEFLYLAKIIFSSKELQNIFESSKWWLLRANFVHQLILEEISTPIFEESEKLIADISQSSLLENSWLKTLFHLEVAHFYLYYKRIQSSDKHLEIAENSAKLKLELTGVMGTRTKDQQFENAQLFLKVEVGKDLFSSRICDDMPVALSLNDDVRLEKIKISEEVENVELGCLEEAVILTKFLQLKVSQPKHDLTTEEITTYIARVIESTKNWALKISSLYQRSMLEANHKRTIERSLVQIEYLIDQLNDEKVEVSHRMDMFFVSGMKPMWAFREALADQKLNLGLVKGALDLYINLHLWEDVILCYTILNLKSKAAEIIRQEIDKKPTVKLWCLLGDATNEEEHYETAWKLSEEKSSRAQRHWGMFHFHQKNYKEAVPHLKQSVELNNIQEGVWSRLGFACLEIEDWKLAATAYRRYCDLEQSDFEVWNNLAKAYIKLGDKPRAYRALQDAIRCNYDRWEVWDNLMVVSIDLGRFPEVIRCYHRILELKSQHLDIQILRILTKAITNDIKDNEGNSSRKVLPKALELFGRITSSMSNDSEVWTLYAELNALSENELSNQKTAQYLQRAYRAAVSDPKWFQRVESTQTVLEMCVKLAQANEHCSRNCSTAQKRAMLGSAKLSLQSVVRKVKDQELSEQVEIVDRLQMVEERLTVISEELEKIKDL
ncbi:tetratricopeptide repeat protein 27 [Belonocnema kinseyi]|uniref:tetratricopeptide repeat protein 27 n=1 Tax=Belonocnema kinseyi TaxID=2817044 RepID=UPI00143CCCAF|nr:tetratricopeptide repeat protein 27 [Belonocnema kinseyi]